METRHLRNAPIKEALIDLQVALPQDAGIELLDKCDKEISEGYRTKKPIKVGTFGVNWSEDQPLTTTMDHEILGYRYESDDKTQVVQVRTNGFTFSKLERYTTWEDMKAEARRLWTVYADATSPEVITRVATRYINVMRIPLPIRDFEEYLTAPPQVPNNLPQGINSYLTRIVLPEPNLGAVGIITQALEKLEKESAPIVLDIDVFVGKHFDASSEEYWGCLEKLRTFKNQIFFGSITEKTGGLFE